MEAGSTDPIVHERQSKVKSRRDTAATWRDAGPTDPFGPSFQLLAPSFAGPIDELRHDPGGLVLWVAGPRTLSPLCGTRRPEGIHGDLAVGTSDGMSMPLASHASAR